MQPSSTEGITRSSQNNLLRRKSKHSRDIWRIYMNENSFIVSFFFCFYLLLSHCFSLLSAFLFPKPFRNNKMHCEIIDNSFNVFFVEIQLKSEKLEKCFLASELRRPNRCTGLPTNLNTSLADLGRSALRQNKSSLSASLSTIFGLASLVTLITVVFSRSILHLKTFQNTKGTQQIHKCILYFCLLFLSPLLKNKLGAYFVFFT